MILLLVLLRLAFDSQGVVESTVVVYDNSAESISMISLVCPGHRARVSTRIARVAKSSAAAVSDACSTSEEQHTSSHVRLRPFKLEHKIFVKLESRTGT